jgi:hypothetical protein
MKPEVEKEQQVQGKYNNEELGYIWCEDERKNV